MYNLHFSFEYCVVTLTPVEGYEATKITVSYTCISLLSIAVNSLTLPDETIILHFSFEYCQGTGEAGDAGEDR